MANGTFGVPDWLGYGALGLGGLSDIFGAYSRQQQARKMDAIRRLLTDPGSIAAGGRAVAGDLSDAARQQVMRTAQIDPSLRGMISGGAYNQYIADALAKMETDRLQSGTDAYIRALTGATGAVPGAAGGTGGFGSALQTLAFLRMMQGPKTTGQAPSFAEGQGMDWTRGWGSYPQEGMGSNIVDMLRGSPAFQETFPGLTAGGTGY